MKKHLVKGSIEAKRYMAKLRAKRTVGAVKKKVVKKAAPKKAAKKAAPKKPSLHKDTKSHNVNIKVVSGLSKSKKLQKDLKSSGLRLTHGYNVVKRKKIGTIPTFNDPDAAREIELYGDNDSQLYFSQKRPILINLSKKHKKGTYKIELAAKLWLYFIEATMKKYNKEFGSPRSKWHELLSVPDRKLLALQYAVETENEFNLGNYTEK